MKSKAIQVLTLGAIGVIFLALPVAANATGRSVEEPADGPGASEASGVERAEDGISDEELEAMAAQAQVHEVLDSVMNALEPEEIAGYAMTRMLDDDKGAIVYWKGEPPAAVLALTQRTDMTFVIQQAAYSELDETSIARQIKENWNPDWGRFTGVGSVDAEGSILKVLWDPTEGVAEDDVRSGLRDIVPEIGDARFEESSLFLADSRWDGSSPWKAGAGLATGAGASNTMCTVGAPVWKNDHTYLLTAGHCGSRTFTDGDGDAIGTTMQNWYDSDVDAQLINARASVGLFYGGWSNSPGPTKDINGLQDNAIGDIVCHSGANSGERCSLKVFDYYSNGVLRHWRASNPTNPAAAVAGGDSGAPVYHRSETNARLHGLLIGYILQIDCGSTPMRLTTHCGRDIVFLAISTVLTKIGATLKHV
ncbi:MAG: hypothetical protein QM602_01370 [Microbacterium sp.]